MKGIHIGDDQVRLYFTNYENRPDDEEFEEVISILQKNNCKIINNILGPDCDLIESRIGNFEFTVIRTIDGDGTFLYCDDAEGMLVLEKMFEE